MCLRPKPLTYVRLPPMTGLPFYMSGPLSCSTGWAFTSWPKKSVRWRGATAMERRPSASGLGCAGSETLRARRSAKRNPR